MLFAVVFLFLMTGIVNARKAGILNSVACGDVLTSSYTMISDLLNCPGNGIIIGANGITLDCQGHTISGSGGGYGVYLTGVSGNTIKNCIITNFSDGIDLYYSSSNNVINNTANSNSYSGIYVESSSNDIITNNTANSNPNSGIAIIFSSNNNILTSNTANSNGGGIWLSYSSNNILTGNTANSNADGIMLYSSASNTLTNNTANSNWHGIMLLYSSSNNNTITSNTANSNQYGIELWYSTNNNNIISNTINSNVQYGIYSDGSDNYNLIYNNYLSNKVNAVDAGTNFWSTTKTLGTNIIGGPYIGGNYWSDYNGFDTTNPPDGIGDTLVPYTSNGNIANGGDYLPLTTRVPIHCGDTLTSSYNMTSDLLNCQGNGLAIGANNIVLDCQGHKLTGNNTGSGIYLSGVSGVTIKNCMVTNFIYGIYLSYSSNDALTNNTLNSNGDGIYLQFSPNNILTNNTANSNQVIGIMLYSPSSNSNTLTNNIANSNGGDGIELGEPSSNVLTNNTVNSNGRFGILVGGDSNNNALTNNTANSNHYGIGLWSCSNNILTDNSVNSNSYYGIQLIYGSTDNIIYNNYFSNAINAYDDGSGGPQYWNTTKTLGTNIVGGPYIGGNFWSDYTGKDTDDDRIGNTNLPYNNGIAIGGDYLPLVVPGITIFSPINNANYYKMNVLLNFTVNIPTSWIAYSLNGKPNITITGPINITAPANMTGSATLVNGLNTLTVYARNNHGNTVYSSVSFNYCKGDTTGDKKVNVLDLIKVASNLNKKCGDANYTATVDMNDDCAINVLDLIAVSSDLNAVC